MLIGGTATGWICLACGVTENLVGINRGVVHNSLFWLMGVFLSVVFGGVLGFAVLKLISLVVRFPLSPRLSRAALVTLGIVAASVSTIASCLMIDLGPHPEMHFRKGPDVPFPSIVLVICAMAPLLLVKRAAFTADNPESKIVDQGQDAEEGQRKLITTERVADMELPNA
jgi:hypothetical protein